MKINTQIMQLVNNLHRFCKMLTICNSTFSFSKSDNSLEKTTTRPVGAMVARLTPDQKVGCSNHSRSSK
ncbi:hypothetical protein T4B_5163 [Trichinella pseudospiralis]|uniref:Uncharacterized protein n=1 Tax=Trichinella pseudospiralis TaxID=6337 RepID=A0A0V1JEA3_TRIPS|nr:hypothetical protein T4B_5163 [Trichinella pseudospiralis]